MPETVTFIGWHDSGKTTILCRVVERLKDRGWNVAVIKSSSHKGIVFDKKGTDTDRLKEAGAQAVALIAPDQMVIFGENRGMPLPALAQRYFPDADIVIGEGFKSAQGVDKIEVAASGRAPSLFKEVRQVVAVVTDQEAPGVMVFKTDEVDELAQFIEKRYILKDRDKPSASLLVNGRAIPLKFFVQQAIAGAVSGLVDSLKGTKGAETIEILVKLPKK